MDEKAVYIFSQCVCAMIRMEAMKADNAQRVVAGESPSYGEDDFNSLEQEFKIGHNDVIGYFYDR